MMFSRIRLASLMVFVLAAPAAADESANLVVKLGQDTTSVEHFTRSSSRIEVDQVGRAPRVLGRHFVYDFDKGSLSHVSAVIMPPGGTTPTQTFDASFVADSIHLVVRNGAAPPTNVSALVPKGTLVVAGSSPWSLYESRLESFVKGKPDSLRTSMYFLGAPNTDWLLFQKLGKDSVAISNGHMDVYHVKVDKDGRVLGVQPISGTQKFSVQRVDKLDLKAMGAEWLAREQSGAGMGMLSPRDTVNADAGGAKLWVDYGRPGKRGRVVFGGIVPYGEVWRTGANAATQFKTDKALDFHGTTVPAGFYTLWTIPTATGWKFVVNSETGEWGTEHKAAKDLYTIDMQLSSLQEVVERFTISVDPNPAGGRLNLDWDKTRASVDFLVKP
jgi:Protein of unknown function (DUF2911)